MTRPRTLLLVEDGTEYRDALSGLIPAGAVEILRAGDFETTRRILAERKVDAVLLDVVFDRTAPEKLVGDLAALAGRFGGDRRRAERHLAENQGFYLLNELAPLLPDGIPVAIAYDFSAEPERLAALHRVRKELSGIADGTPLSAVLERLLPGFTSGDIGVNAEKLNGGQR